MTDLAATVIERCEPLGRVSEEPDLLVRLFASEAMRRTNDLVADWMRAAGGYSETEILFPYAGTIFASKLGRLAGDHFLTVVDGKENLRALGEMCLWEGAQNVVFDHA
jgi:hypothetical protein